MSLLQDDDPHGQQGRAQNQEHGPAANPPMQNLRQEVHAQESETQINLTHDQEDRPAGVEYDAGSSGIRAASQGVLLRRGPVEPQVPFLQWPFDHDG